MTAAHVLQRGRIAAESLMLDSVTGFRPGAGEGTWDEDLGVTTPPAPTQVYAGRGRVQVTDSLNGAERVVGDVEFSIAESTLQLPVLASVGIRRGDWFQVTAAQHDPDLIGRVLHVVAEHAKSHATARRLRCRTVTSEGELPAGLLPLLPSPLTLPSSNLTPRGNP